jgi:hypothetical protein
MAIGGMETRVRQREYRKCGGGVAADRDRLSGNLRMFALVFDPFLR